jgi:hypothetical protein
MKEFEDDFGVAAPVSPRPTPTTSAPVVAHPTTEVTKEPAKPKPKPQKKKQPQKPKQPETLVIDEPVFISSAGEYEEKIKPILQAFVASQRDSKATVAAIRDLDAPEYRHKIIEVGIQLTIEKGDKERDAMSKLFSTLSSDRLLKEDSYVTGYFLVEDYIGDFIARL